MNVQNRLMFLVAPARSGKSTYAKVWERYQDTQTLNGMFPKNNPRVRVNADELRLAMHGCRYNGIMERLVHPFNEILIDKYLNMGYDVLVDETHCSEHAIKKILAIREDAIPIYIKASLEQCYERAYSSGQPDLVELGVIDRMFRNLRKVWNTYYKKPEINGMLQLDPPPWKPFEEATPEDFEYIVDRIREEGIPKHTNRIVTA